MKKTILALVFASGLTTMTAQTDTEQSTESSNFNRWTIELAGGFNKPAKPLTNGYYTSPLSPYVVDFGARYMFNNKFGLKADFGFNHFANDNSSKDFKSDYYRVAVQGVANLGRIMNFEEFTQTFGLLAHTGFGVAQATFDNGRDNDLMINLITGVTAQIKLSNRIALTGDFSVIYNTKQDVAFDGYSLNKSDMLSSGVLLNGTIGLSYSLGKYDKHADWYARPIVEVSEIAALNKKIADIESTMQDTDKDGVPDYLDQEQNTIAGVMVNTKGQSIDVNNNSIPDELESYLTRTYGDNSESTVITKNNESVKRLINSGYICAYFDYNSTTPTNDSTDGINFVLTYLRNNPSATVDIVGHADELGKTAYNDKLAAARANTIKDIFVKSKIDASRVNVISAGEDTSVDKTSNGARKLVRKVTFTVK
ncbi:OmpA family protein [Flavobacterium sp. HJJ]|uniref:OmpA family protein n=1 Tax=Flavobacterium sp. HJJ TaxID=2783792 RepID=UPI00188A7015|nr:OmpA family protein [Flavobacterium sp. HJJ]MBF4472702.1 OmpA family protein [Flavobacterium sp. HJJ]